jgi:hypothetical protein
MGGGMGYMTVGDYIEPYDTDWDEDEEDFDYDMEWEDWDDNCFTCGHLSHIGSCYEDGCDCGEDWE